MEVIQHYELSSSQSSIVFSNIPQTYTDLVLRYALRTDRASAHLDKIRFSFNGTSNANWALKQLIGFGTGNGYTEGGSEAYFITYAGSSTTATANTFASAELYIQNYTSSEIKSAFSSGVVETSASNAWQILSSGYSPVTAAVSSIVINKEFGANFVAGSSATLYGVLAGSDGITNVS